MLLASHAAITRNACARSAFQPHLAVVFAFFFRSKTCPLFAAGRLKCCSRLSWLSQEMAVRDRHSSRIWPGCSLSGCGPKPVRFLLPVGRLAVREPLGCSERWLPRLCSRAAAGVCERSWFLPERSNASRDSRAWRRLLPLLS